MTKVDGESGDDADQAVPESTVEKEQDEDRPLVIPSLPEPSKAVQRSRRGKATADIWASNEEVDYERRANKVDLEADEIGAAAPKTKKKKNAKKPPLAFYYQIASRVVELAGIDPDCQSAGLGPQAVRCGRSGDDGAQAVLAALVDHPG